jgi:hypothetical protein
MERLQTVSDRVITTSSRKPPSSDFSHRCLLYRLIPGLPD